MPLIPKTADPLLQVENLGVRFATTDGEVEALGDVSFTLAQGEALGVVGESGSGKSLTALALMGLLPARASARGRINFAGQELLQLPEAEWQRLRGARLAMVFQDPMTSLNPHLRIGVQMAEGLQRHRGGSRAQALAECARMLDAVRMPEPQRQLRQYPHELSGGQRQRVLIGMALLCRPQLLIADEPTTALDVTVQAQILDLLAELRREFQLAVLLISHDLGVIAELCERTLVMYAGRVVEHRATAALLQQPQHPYTAGLLASRPGLAAGPLPGIPGQPPQLTTARAAGCPFAPRCSRRLPVCAQQMPPWSGPSQCGSACHLSAPGHVDSLPNS